MARFLFVSWWGGGNVQPVAALGHGLAGRGHDVVVLGDAKLREQVEAAGLRLRVTEGFASAEDVRAALDGEEPDAAIVDFMMPAALSALEAEPGVRTGALVHTRFQQVLDREGDFVGAFTSVDQLNDLRRALGLDELAAAVELLDEGRVDRVLVAGPRAIDGEPATPVPGHVRYLGALTEPLPAGASWSPPAPPAARPVVAVTLGTTPMGEEPVLQRVLDALAGLDVDAVVTVGRHIDAAGLRVPPNATVSGYVPHALVLPHASVLVTHAGLGTVVAGLRAGRPLLCLPLGRDQPGNAARVEALGAGRQLAPDASVEEIAAALAALLAPEAPERAAAARVAGEVAAASSPGAPADAVEELAAPA